MKLCTSDRHLNVGRARLAVTFGPDGSAPVYGVGGSPGSSSSYSSVSPNAECPSSWTAVRGQPGSLVVTQPTPVGPKPPYSLLFTITRSWSTNGRPASTRTTCLTSASSPLIDLGLLLTQNWTLNAVCRSASAWAGQRVAINWALCGEMAGTPKTLTSERNVENGAVFLSSWTT